MGSDRFGFTSLPRKFNTDRWNNIPGFTVIEEKNGYIVLRYKGGTVRDLLNAIKAEPLSDRCRLSFIVFGKRHRWCFDYVKQIDHLHLYRVPCSFGMLKKKSKKTSRFYGVSYDRVISDSGNWIAFYYIVPQTASDEDCDIANNGRNRKMIARFTNEHEAAVAHDAFVLWWNMKGKLNYPRFKRPKDVEELFMCVTPKEKFMDGFRPDCYACVHHKELPANARISCNANGATVVGHQLGILHGWFNYPLNFDPLWVQTCDKFLVKGGTLNEQEPEGFSKEEGCVTESERINSQCKEKETGRNLH